MPTPRPTVVLHVWTVAPRNAPQAMSLLARQRRDVRALPFGKLLGTGSGETFAVRHVNLTRFAMLTCWPSAMAAGVFERGPLIAAWDRLARSRRRIELRPTRSRGTWSGQTPFGAGDFDDAAGDGPIAVLTHARIRPTRLVSFLRAVPPVAKDLTSRPGSSFRLAFGEAPVGVQGTFSIWEDLTAMTAFAYDPAHRAVIRRRASEHWYAEEIFARFAVISDA